MKNTITKYFEYSMRDHQQSHAHRFEFGENHKVKNILNSKHKIKIKNNEFP